MRQGLDQGSEGLDAARGGADHHDVTLEGHGDHLLTPVTVAVSSASGNRDRLLVIGSRAAARPFTSTVDGTARSLAMVEPRRFPGAGRD